MTLTIRGATLLAAVGQDGRVRVERLLSTDPAHFLDASLGPGTDITAEAACAGDLGPAARPARAGVLGSAGPA